VIRTIAVNKLDTYNVLMDCYERGQRTIIIDWRKFTHLSPRCWRHNGRSVTLQCWINDEQVCGSGRLHSDSRWSNTLITLSLSVHAVTVAQCTQIDTQHCVMAVYSFSPSLGRTTMSTRAPFHLLHPSCIIQQHLYTSRWSLPYFAIVLWCEYSAVHAHRGFSESRGL